MQTESGGSVATGAFGQLERGVHAALETYSNVHRGRGHHSLVSTHLFEQARRSVLDHMGLGQGSHVVIFGSPRTAAALMAQLEPGKFHVASSRDVGLPLGVRALAVERRALPKRVPFVTGGGTARLVSPDSVIWAAAPDRFEAGTPAIVNVIAFAKALRLIRQLGPGAFADTTIERLTADEILLHDELEHCSGRELLNQLRQTLIGRGVSVPTTSGARRYVNLDNGASTPTFEAVWTAVRRTWRQPDDVRQAVVQAVKAIVADVLGAPPETYEVVFTSNTTEAINLVAESLGTETGRGDGRSVVNTLLEHNSNELPWRQASGSSPIRVSIDADGFVNTRELEELLRARNESGDHGDDRVGLVAVSGASNVLGTFNDLAEIARLAHRYGARLLVDAAQLVAHRKVAMESIGIDYLAFSAHKAYAPFGTGVLVARRGLLGFRPAEMEPIRLSGEENVGGIAALGKAFVLLQRVGLDVIQEEEQALTARALRGMKGIQGMKLLGIADPESPAFARKGGVIPFDLKGAISHTVARELAARAGIGVRSGCHCAHLTVKRMVGVPPWAERVQAAIVTLFRRFELPGVVRVSLGIENTEEDVDALIRALDEIARRPKGGPSKKEVRRQVKELCEAAAARVY